MEMYKKPVMEIVELEKVDVLTKSVDNTRSITSTTTYAFDRGGETYQIQ